MKWMTLREAADGMGMSTRHGALKRLRRLESATGESIVRRTGQRWEVSAEALRRAIHEPVHCNVDLEERMRVNEEKVEALRRTAAGFRKTVREEFKKYSHALEKISQANKAANDALEAVLCLSNGHQRTPTDTSSPQ